jgi:hypothetical protein
MEKALTAPAADWPSRSITVSGVSDNEGTRWNLDDGRRWLGYAPRDNIAAG